MSDKRIESFDEFWPFYLGEHSNQVCRMLHFLGTSIGMVTLVLAIVTLNPWLLIPAVLSGYFWAWIGHFFVEKNKPASFSYPVWSFMADFRMWSLMLRGRLWSTEPVLRQAGVEG